MTIREQRKFYREIKKTMSMSEDDLKEEFKRQMLAWAAEMNIIKMKDSGYVVIEDEREA